MTSEAVLTLRDLSRPGVAPVSMALNAGEIAALSGPSGSGKSLFLRAIADLDPSTGEILLAGQAREALPAPTWRQRVAYIPAESGWWDERVCDHMSDQDAAAAHLDKVGLPSDALDWTVARLSTGEKQRLALIRALVLNPAVLLLDEPTGGLDPAATTAVETLIREICASGTAALVVSHDPGQAERLGATRYNMNNGTLSVGAAP